MVSLAAVPGRPGVLASLGRDGTVRFWDVVSQQRLATVPAEATAMVGSPISAGCCLRTSQQMLMRLRAGFFSLDGTHMAHLSGSCIVHTEQLMELLKM